MPILENELHQLAGAKCYANFDLSYAYWQLELAKDRQECPWFITPQGVYTPTRVYMARPMPSLTYNQHCKVLYRLTSQSSYCCGSMIS